MTIELTKVRPSITTADGRHLAECLLPVVIDASNLRHLRPARPEIVRHSTLRFELRDGRRVWATLCTFGNWRFWIAHK
jgi:hypothetical protein